VARLVSRDGSFQTQGAFEAKKMWNYLQAKDF